MFLRVAKARFALFAYWCAWMVISLGDVRLCFESIVLIQAHFCTFNCYKKFQYCLSVYITDFLICYIFL